jgi:hypothetical protein
MRFIRNCATLPVTHTIVAAEGYLEYCRVWTPGPWIAHVCHPSLHYHLYHERNRSIWFWFDQHIQHFCQSCKFAPILC